MRAGVLFHIEVEENGRARAETLRTFTVQKRPRLADHSRARDHVLSRTSRAASPFRPVVGRLITDHDGTLPRGQRDRPLRSNGALRQGLPAAYRAAICRGGTVVGDGTLGTR